MKRQEAETVRKAEATAAATRAEEARALFELRRTVLDTSLPEADRAAALSKLRGIKGGIDREVVFAVIDLFRISRSLVVREGILRDVHGTRDPDLKQLFLDTLTRDPEATLRERAARDIDDYLDDPAVRQALESARDGDASETVRRAAERTLQPRSREKK